MEILTNLTDIIKGMKTWAKLLAIALIVGEGALAMTGNTNTAIWATLQIPIN